MRTATAFWMLLLSTAFATTPDTKAQSSSNPEDVVVSLRPFSGAFTPAIALPGLEGFTFGAGPIHTAGWREDGRKHGFSEAESEADAVVPVDPAVICRALENAAEAHDLPLLFFARLIWQESRFRTDAVSRAGAQGVAQFMPTVAAEMGLDDPFDPVQALPVSARLLARLYERFGNWGLAAAAYNGGPRRVSEWLSRKGKLPKETRHYVKTITGLTAEEWAETTPKAIAFRRPPRLPCDNLPYMETHASPGLVPLPPDRPENLDIAEASAAASRADRKEGEGRKQEEVKPWAVQLAAHWSPKQALATFERLRKQHPKVLADRRPDVVAAHPLAAKGARRQRVQIAMETRAGAEQLCARLKAAGGACLVRRN